MRARVMSRQIRPKLSPPLRPFLFLSQITGTGQFSMTVFFFFFFWYLVFYFLSCTRFDQVLPGYKLMYLLLASSKFQY